MAIRPTQKTRSNRAQSELPVEETPRIDEMLDLILPKGPGQFVKRLVILKAIAWLVRNGFMHKGAADRLKHPDGTPTYIPRRQKIARSMSDEDLVVLTRLIDHAFPSDNKPPNRGHYDTLVGLAQKQGISETTVQEYLQELLDTRTARDIGLLT